MKEGTDEYKNDLMKSPKWLLVEVIMILRTQIEDLKKEIYELKNNIDEKNF